MSANRTLSSARITSVATSKFYFPWCFSFFFFFNDTATTEIYTLSLHDALPIFPFGAVVYSVINIKLGEHIVALCQLDRKSGSAGMPRPISYAVFCLKKKTWSPTWNEASCLTTAAAGRAPIHGFTLNSEHSAGSW